MNDYQIGWLEARAECLLIVEGAVSRMLEVVTPDNVSCTLVLEVLLNEARFDIENLTPPGATK